MKDRTSLHFEIVMELADGLPHPPARRAAVPAVALLYSMNDTS